ncbi:hypothetical protein DP113_34535 (plasmid) [Brasilonema octagenarum UFV-E1]|uniref:Uncharacterized protein n=2 Tax=Brasilonema TaxID=383614 RepID=A0A856MPZ9_9CYAN|nr:MULTISPECIES: hypothetical protein [Brasilonema]NMF63258.1 hypothetical protein [Brasilonema octagenarum UFV-OR1]QDL12828.1 hypothetical protein DP114_34430 [Brasilonema sennae CENA114]QDL19224.1 hypothetical protein DP113_34535 [Brasilonema octagenarum UFV-E1]
MYKSNQKQELAYKANLPLATSLLKEGFLIAISLLNPKIREMAESILSHFIHIIIFIRDLPRVILLRKIEEESRSQNGLRPAPLTGIRIN